MTQSRQYTERITIETSTGEEPGYSALCQRRASVDMQTLQIEIIADTLTDNLEYRNTRIIWHKRGGDKVLNLNAIFVTDGRRPVIRFQAVSEQFQNADSNTPRLTDINGVEAIFAT